MSTGPKFKVLNQTMDLENYYTPVWIILSTKSFFFEISGNQMLPVLQENW